jgi:hypothetical protein
MLVGIFTIHPFSSMSVSCYYSRSDTWEPDRSTTRNYLTAGTLDWPTAGTLLFAGDNLAGGKALPLASSISPAVTCRYPRRLPIFASGICYPRHMPKTPAIVRFTPGTCHVRQRYVCTGLKKKTTHQTSTFTI